MKWGFILALYMGPLGVLLYVLADKEPGHHTTNNIETRGGGGLMVVIDVVPR